MPRKTQQDKREKKTDNAGMLGLAQAARVLGISRSTLTRMLREGRIRGFKVGRQWRFRRSELEKLSQMSHPSAAGVNVPEIRKLTAGTGVPAKEVADLVLEPLLRDYPTTEEEKALEALLRALLIDGAKAGASDIHIDAERDGTTVRQRVDGVLHEVLRLPRSAHDAFAACIKAHAGIPLDQRALPQDGRLRVRLGGKEYDARTATIPAVYGESVVLRLLVQAVRLVQLDQLGMHPKDLDRYQRALAAPCGLLIAAGPTGCGKTTVLYAGLRKIATPEKKTMTVEDPVEYTFPHVTQTAVNRKAGYTFEAAQRAVFRHDPDVIMVGNIRTLESAELCAQYAITGHLVMTVLHAHTAAGAVTRLFDMGLEPFMVAQTLIYVSAQRLARKVCPKCAQPDKPDFDVLSPLAERARVGGYCLPDNPKFMRGAGCDHCRQTGYRGRTGLYEAMEVDREIQKLIAARAATAELQEAAVRNGMTTLAADGLRKAAAGVTTVVEVARLLPEERA